MNIGKTYIQVDEGRPGPTNPAATAALNTQVLGLVTTIAAVRREGVETRGLVDDLRIESVAHDGRLNNLDIVAGQLSTEMDIRRNDSETAIEATRRDAMELSRVLSETILKLEKDAAYLRVSLSELRERVSTPWWRRLLNWLGVQ